MTSGSVIVTETKSSHPFASNASMGRGIMESARYIDNDTNSENELHEFLTQKSKINNMTDYKSELDKYNIDDTIMLRILRDKNPFYLAFEIK